MMLVRDESSFYLLRFVLGIAEAGFFPGIIFYLNEWFPSQARARAIARFMTAIPISGMIGGPVSGLLLGLDGWLGVKGWQWLFFLEGIPAVLLGVVVWLYLPDRPENAGWLLPEQRQWLAARLAAADRQKTALVRALDDPQVQVRLEAARALEFEKAARLRDQLAILKEQAFGAAGHDHIVPIQAARK